MTRLFAKLGSLHADLTPPNNGNLSIDYIFFPVTYHVRKHWSFWSNYGNLRILLIIVADRKQVNQPPRLLNVVSLALQATASVQPRRRLKRPGLKATYRREQSAIDFWGFAWSQFKI